MPCTKKYTIDKSQPVLVTGADGYVAGVLTRSLLEEGLTVHGTVLDLNYLAGLSHLKNVAAKTPGTLKLFEANLLNEGSFEQAMEGCAVVFHAASPFILRGGLDVTKDLIDPAVKGTANVLLQANKTPTVQRVVLTGSVGAIHTDNADCIEAPAGILNEEAWNRGSTLTHQPYFLSKSLAELKAWIIAGSQDQWKLVVINPGLILGPGLKYHPTTESFKTIMRIGSGDYTMIGGAPNFGIGIVDVREVAAAHMAAAFLPEASGRHIICGYNTSIATLAAILRKEFPTYPVPAFTAFAPKFIVWLLIPYVGMGFDRLFITRNLNVPVSLDNTKSKQALGIEYRPLEETVHEMFQQLIDCGSVKPGSLYVAVLMTAITFLRQFLASLFGGGGGGGGASSKRLKIN